jgi:hypothetical protein
MPISILAWETEDDPIVGATPKRRVAQAGLGQTRQHIHE